MDNIKAIFFDFDNTLGDRYTYSKETFRDLIDEFLPEIEKDGLLYSAILHDLTVFDQFGDSGNSRLILDRIEKRYGVSIGIDNYYDWWSDNQYKHACVFPDTVETIEKLRQKYKVGILTNGRSKNQWSKIRKAGVEDLFDTIVVSGDLGYHKPDIRIFEEARNRFGLKPEECLFVGDNFYRDICGAVNAGWKVVWMWLPEQDSTNYPIIRIRKLSELLNYLPLD